MDQFLSSDVDERLSILASVSHEFRTPLTVIVGVNETLRNGSLEPQIRLLLEAQARAIERLEALVGHVISVSGVIAKDGRRDRQHLVDLIDVVRSAMWELRPLGAEERVTVATPDGETSLLAVPSIVWLLVTGLLEDRLHASAPDGPVDVQISYEGGDILIRFHLTGAARGRETARTSPHGGFGVGILAATQLVARLAGQLELPRYHGDDLVVALPQRRASDPPRPGSDRGT